MFRTELNPKNSTQNINHSTPIITIGSCFSDQIGSHFIKNKFNVVANPFGTVYNPISICKLLQLAIKNNPSKVDTYVEHQGLHSNYDFHSSFSSTSLYETQQLIKSAIKNTHNYLKNTRFLIITFGTSFVYERVDSNEIVANCHKLPSDKFRKILLSESEIINVFDSLKQELDHFNIDLQIILTVSPVRHIKDTLELNSVSKSTLRIACNTLLSKYNSVSYFPSYEIVLDDLRDYRFYKPDMIHPNEVAEDYIWQKFQDTYFNEYTSSLLKSWGKLRAAIGHKPFNPQSEEHQKFLKDTLIKLESIEREIEVTDEIRALKDQLALGN